MVSVQSKEDFQRHVIDNTEKMVLVNFWTWWSDASATMTALFSTLENDLKKDHSIVCVDWDQQKWLAEQLQVFGVPTLLVFDRGRVCSRISGVVSSYELLAYLDEVKKKKLDPGVES